MSQTSCGAEDQSNYVFAPVLSACHCHAKADCSSEFVREWQSIGCSRTLRSHIRFVESMESREISGIRGCQGWIPCSSSSQSVPNGLLRQGQYTEIGLRFGSRVKLLSRGLANSKNGGHGAMTGAMTGGLYLKLWHDQRYRALYNDLWWHGHTPEMFSLEIEKIFSLDRGSPQTCGRDDCRRVSS